MSFTVISTFSGCGGSSLGYKLAGGKVLLAVEWEKDAQETYKTNFPDTPLYCGDISKLSSEEIFSITKIKKGQLDIFDGSPPCQGFSMSGKRDFNDNRNQLFKEYCRILKDLQPKCFVMENVKSMVVGKMKFIFVEILKTLKECGYDVSAKVLNAKNYNVPQSRERMFFIGVRKDLNIKPSHPLGNNNLITFSKACKDLEFEENVEVKELVEAVKNLSKVQPLNWSTNKNLLAHFNDGKKGGAINLQWASWGKVLGTITKMETHISGIVHPNRTRYISLSEAKRCASFPDDFYFTNRKNGIARIGNCVPPNMMKAIATHIYENILNKSRKI